MPTKFVNILETSKLRIRGQYLDSVSYVLLHFLTLRLYENLAPGRYAYAYCLHCWPIRIRLLPALLSDTHTLTANTVILLASTHTLTASTVTLLASTHTLTASTVILLASSYTLTASTVIVLASSCTLTAST